MLKREGRRVTLSRKTEKDEALPKGWREVRLKDACDIIVSPVDKKTIDGELPVRLCNYTDVYYNNAIDSKIDFMTATAKPLEIERFSLIEGDVIITKDSETPDDIGVPAYVKETIDNLLCGYHLAILRPKKQTIGKYVCYALASPRVKYDFYRFANGITRFGLTTESYQNIKILLPPLYQQKAIVSLLETWDTAIEKTEALIAAKEKQFKWLLKTLISDQQDNLERRKVKLGEFGTFYKGKGITKADLVEDGIPCLRYAEIYTKYDGIVNELTSSVSPDAATKAAPIQSGDIIFAASGETAAEIGKAIAFVGRYPAVAGGDTVIFRDHGQEPAYLAHVLNSADAARQKARLGKGQSIVHIHIPELFQVEVSLPPLHEQRKIVKILTTWDTAIKKTKALAEQYRTQKRGLMQKLLTGKWRIQMDSSKQ